MFDLSFMIAIFFILIMAVFTLGKNRLRWIDIFTLHHNYEIDQFMKVQKTKTGGFFTILLGLIILYVAFTNIILFYYDNV